MNLDEESGGGVGDQPGGRDGPDLAQDPYKAQAQAQDLYKAQAQDLYKANENIGLKKR